MEPLPALSERSSDSAALRAGWPEAARDPMIGEINRFARRSLHCSACVFYWVEDGRAASDAGISGLPPALWDEYLADMVGMDPLSVHALVSAGSVLARLPGQDHGGVPRRYQEFLAHHSVRDVVDMLFYAHGEVIAGLGVIKLDGDEPLSPATLDLADSMRPLIETSLHQHERVRRAVRHKRLVSVYRLTSREVEVAELVTQGCSNDTVAQRLMIRLPTVKTHLLSIFGKTATASRTELARLLYA